MLLIVQKNFASNFFSGESDESEDALSSNGNGVSIEIENQIYSQREIIDEQREKVDGYFPDYSSTEISKEDVKGWATDLRNGRASAQDLIEAYTEDGALDEEGLKKQIEYMTLSNDIPDATREAIANMPEFESYTNQVVRQAEEEINRLEVQKNQASIGDLFKNSANGNAVVMCG